VSGGTPGSTGAELALTPALEDYLETIFALVRETGMARVRDIASARGVRPAPSPRPWPAWPTSAWSATPAGNTSP